MSATVQTKALSFDFYGKRALRNVSISVVPSKITALVGPNGAGKTTLLRCLAALEVPFIGSVEINGIDTQRDPHGCHQFLGYLSDSFGLYDDLKVAACLDHAAEIRGITGAGKYTALAAVVEKLDLGKLLGQLAGTLSRGQRQRVAIAQAIIHNPPIILLDEPASGLDPEARLELSGLLCSLRDGGATIVVSSHILAELEDYSDLMLTLREGEVTDYVPLHTDHIRGVRLRIQISGDAAALASSLNARSVVAEVDAQGSTVSLLFRGSEMERADLLRALVQEGHRIHSFSEEKQTMQNVYMQQLSREERGK